MKYPQRLLVLLTLSVSLIGCDDIINKAGAEYLKMSLTGVCGEDDSACVAAVEEQFDPCHKKYEQEWQAYMDSSTSEEDALLTIYSEHMYACIVDEDGEPYFYFDPTAL